MRLSTKFGLGAIACLALGFGSCSHSANANREYRALVKTASQTVPEVMQFDALENAVKDLYEAHKELTSYKVGKSSHHSPNVDDAVFELGSARENIAKGQFVDNYETRTIDDQIRVMQKQLERTEKGQSEQFYEPQRAELKGLQERTEAEISNLKTKVPTRILKQKEALKSTEKNYEIFGIISLMISSILGAVYVAVRSVGD